jgi:hypothetical protein
MDCLISFDMLYETQPNARLFPVFSIQASAMAFRAKYQDNYRGMVFKRNEIAFVCILTKGLYH